MNTLKNELINFYLSYVNEYLTVDRISEDYNISPSDAKTLIALGKEYNDDARLIRLILDKNEAKNVEVV